MTTAQRISVAAAVGVGAWLGRSALRGVRYSFRDRVVVITGGSRGLGLEMARVFAADGARLALVARDEAALDRARQELAACGVDVFPVPCDIADREQVDAAIGLIVDHFGRLDVLVNNAGVIQVGPMEHMGLDDYEAAMAVHFRGPLHTMLAAIPHMRRQHGGRIVNISSIGGKIPVPHLAPYAASKFALVGLSSSLRAELAKDDILVTTVCPGLMRTGSPINASMKGQHEKEFAWFVAGDSMPGLSIGAARAARQIVDACRSGRAELIVTLQARIAVALYGLMPDTFVQIASVANAYFLPAPTGAEGDRARLGRDSRSPATPSILTALTDRAAARNNELPRPASAS